jgi:hypothetical protein
MPLHYISKTAAKTDGRLLQDAQWMKLDMLLAMHLRAEPWRLITHSTIKNCFVKYSFPIYHESSNDDSAVQFTDDDDDDDDWQSLHPL